MKKGARPEKKQQDAEGIARLFAVAAKVRHPVSLAAVAVVGLFVVLKVML